MTKKAQEIVEKIREGLTGEYNVDIVYLEAEVEKLRGHKEINEIESAVADIAYEILPSDRREKLDRMMYIDGKRMDVVFANAKQLVNDAQKAKLSNKQEEYQQKMDEAIKLSEALYTKIRISYREDEKEVYLSFRNPLEHEMYLAFFTPSKKLVRPWFDLSGMILLHGFILADLKRYDEALRVLGDAIRYNPMNVDAYLEMQEIYKVTRDVKALLACVKETMEIAVSPYQIARCYSSLGYYAVEVKEFDDAVCYYYESVLYANNDDYSNRIAAELHYIQEVTKKKITPPTREEITKAFEHIGMESGANKDVVSIVAQLAQRAIEEKQLSAVRFYLHVLVSLTNDPEYIEIRDRYEEIAKTRGEL